jgi:hypothetical protein
MVDMAAACMLIAFLPHALHSPVHAAKCSTVAHVYSCCSTCNEITQAHAYLQQFQPL